MLSLVPSIYNEALNTIITGDITSPTVVIPDRLINKALIWQTVFATAPNGVRVELWGAPNDLDSQYIILDVSGSLDGEYRKVPASLLTNGNIRFLRVRQSSRSGGSSTVVNILGNDANSLDSESLTALNLIASSLVNTKSTQDITKASYALMLTLLQNMYVEIRIQNEILVDISGNSKNYDLDGMRADLQLATAKEL